MVTDADERGERVLVLAPTGRDAELARATLATAAITAVACRDMDAVCRALAEGAAAVLLTEEALLPPAATCLRDALERQPTWSDLPLVVLTSGGEVTPGSIRMLERLGPHANVTLLERPLRGVTLVSA